MSFIDQNELLEKTNGGLNIILSYYPQAEKCINNKNEKFKIREEKTASTSLKKLPDGVWVVTDFGDDQKPRNGIQVCMNEEGVEFKEALQILGARFGISGSNSVTEAVKYEFKKRKAKASEKEGEYYFKIHKEIPDSALEILGPYIAENHCKYLHFYSLESFTYVKDRQAFETIANDEYPIFLIDEDDFKKIYQPKNPDKKYRFRYYGKKPKNFIHGLEQCIHKYNDLNADAGDYDQDAADAEEQRREKKLPEIILCSGDRDALNVHSLGYNVIWLNSESAKISGDQYKRIMSICEGFYNLPDIDHTGLKQGHELANKYLDIKTIELPPELQYKRDFRGNPCKDVTDFLKHYKRNELRKLIDVATPARFWDELPKYNKKGEWIGQEYYFNNTQAYHFLQINGFFRFENRNEKNGYIFIHFDGNIVDEIDPVKIKGFVNDFLKQRKLPISLRNMVYKTAQLAENSLSNLDRIDIDFTDYDKASQFLFFENKTWCINQKDIKEFKPGQVDKFVWMDEVIPHKVKKLEDFFEVTCTEMEDGVREYDIQIKDTSPMFMKFLIQTCRIHWRKEFEQIPEQLDPKEREKYFQDIRFTIDNPRLDHDEIYEHKLHLINKIYSLGYLLHRYKEPSRPWCVFAMDNKIADESESHGGSGKSIVYNAIRQFMKSVTLNGRNRKLTENPHIYENVTEHTDYIFIDDADRYIDFQFFFKGLTGDLDVNPKNNRQYSIPFKEAPKFCITSNYTLRNIDPSTERRLLYTVFSDYYHYNSNNEYKEHRDPKSDFGINLFDDFTEDEWNLFFNFMAQCLRLYLSHPKIDPPMNNVTKRNLITEMGDAFKKWADVYFSAENDPPRVDQLLVKKEAFENFKDETKMHKWTINRFTRSLKAWCRYYVYELDPDELCNSQGRIIRKKDGIATEMIYIKTTEVINDQENPDKLPF